MSADDQDIGGYEPTKAEAAYNDFTENVVGEVFPIVKAAIQNSGDMPTLIVSAEAPSEMESRIPDSMIPDKFENPEEAALMSLLKV